MEQFHFALIKLLWVTLPIWLICIIVRYYYAKKVIYRTSIASILKRYAITKTPPFRIILNVIRAIVLLLLALLIAQPQWYDESSSIMVNGIDIVLTLDISGSMESPDLSVTGQTRFEIAQQEALRFIEMRKNDAIGLVLFANEAVSRVPVTMDKDLLKSVIRDTSIGILDHDGTLLGHAMLLGINRLKDSHAKSKVMVLLTDGAPSERDIGLDTPIKLAKKYGIKVYTIGVGGNKDIQIYIGGGHYALLPKVNKELLEAIAVSTGGRSFLAQSEQDMREIYETIDKLESTEHEVPLYTQYKPLLGWGIFYLVFLLTIELVLSTFLWFSLC